MVEKVLYTTTKTEVINEEDEKGNKYKRFSSGEKGSFACWFVDTDEILMNLN